MLVGVFCVLASVGESPECNQRSKKEPRHQATGNIDLLLFDQNLGVSEKKLRNR